MAKNKNLEQDMAPFGFISDATNDGDSFVDTLMIDGILMNMVYVIYGLSDEQKIKYKLDKAIFSTIHS